MLVLRRKVGESLRIGNGVTVLVRSIDGNRVSLAIDAPKDVPVHRDEVKAAIEQAENTKGQDDGKRHN